MPEPIADNPSTPTLTAGVAKIDITTDDPAVAVQDRLHARALVLDNTRTRIAIIAMDAVAIGGICEIDDAFLPALKKRIETDLAIPADHILVNASHTHPPGPLLCNPDALIERTVHAVQHADKTRQPVTVGAGAGREPRIMINRTLRLKNGRHETIRQANPCPPDDDLAELGPADDDIVILRFDRPDGTPLAVIYNFAGHPLLGVPDHAVTANYPGFASKVIEDALGHNAAALFIQGAGGDRTEVLYKNVHQPRNAEPVGTRLGLSTLAALKKINTTPDVTLNVITRTVNLPRRTDFQQRIDRLVAEQNQLLASLRFTSLNFKTFLPLYIQYALNGDYPADYAYRYLHENAVDDPSLAALDNENRANIDKYLRNIRAMEKLARIQDDIATIHRHRQINERAGEPTVPAEIVGIRIGPCAIISSPAELLVQIGLNLKAASPQEHTIVAAISNGYIHYGPPAEYYDKGGYEVTECFLAPEWQALYETAAKNILSQL